MASSSIELKVTVNLNGVEATHTIKTSFADMVKYDILRKKKDLPAQAEGTFVFLAVIAYAALIRLGIVPNTIDLLVFLEKNLVDIEAVESEVSEEDAEFQA